MLNHMAIWILWMTRVRGRRNAAATLHAGHTASEQVAFDRMLARRASRATTMWKTQVLHGPRG